MAGLLTYPGYFRAFPADYLHQWQVAEYLLLRHRLFFSRRQAGITAAGTVEDSHLVPF